MSLGMQVLIDKLNAICKTGLETAAQLCVSQTNYSVEIEHFLMKLVDLPQSDLHRIFRYYEVRPTDLKRELTLALDRFKRGNELTPALSPHIVLLLEQAWLLSTLQLDSTVIRSGAVMMALLDHDTLYAMIIGSVPTLKKIPRAAVEGDLVEIIRAESEEASGKSSQAPALKAPTVSRETTALDQFTVDLTQQARKGLIDPIQGRDLEIRQVIDILTRRRQNNPILTGEAGVGKTAVVEGLALKVASGDAPPGLKNVAIRLLDLGLLQAGAGIRGEFEKRLKSVIDEVKGSPHPIILFIDEAHTMIGAGGPAGMGDAANLLKPVLARGELRTIAATTWSEYKKYFEKDPALARRFQVVKINEPDEESAVKMLRGVVANFEKHHRVRVLDSAVRDAVRLSQRYVPGRQLPEKAISVLDTACARVAVCQNVTPAVIQDVTARVADLDLEIATLTRESSVGYDHTDRLDELRTQKKALIYREAELKDHWEAERRLTGRLEKLEKSLEALGASKADAGPDRQKLAGELAQTKAELEKLQAGQPMVPAVVDAGMVAAVISSWTGIPVGRMMSDEIDTVLKLKEQLEARIIGQSQALDVICRRIQTYRAGLDDPGKPVGVFLLTGPSGIGKTETAAALAELLYGGERNMVVVNMSEYQEAYTVSGLKGSPPGYVGHGQGGILTEAVRHNPYTVVLLDEVEKAHPDVLELFYQVFDKGSLEDSEGLTVDFKNTLILLTSNAGSDIILQAYKDHPAQLDPETLNRMIRPALLKHFKPALLGRLVIVPYYPLEDRVLRTIVELKLDKIQRRFAENHRIQLTCDHDVIAAIAARCREVDTGARNVDHVLTQILLPELSVALLKRMALSQVCHGIKVRIGRTGRFLYRFDPPSPDDEPDEEPVEDAAADPEGEDAADVTDESPGSDALRSDEPGPETPAADVSSAPKESADAASALEESADATSAQEKTEKKPKRWIDRFKVFKS